MPYFSPRVGFMPYISPMLFAQEGEPKTIQPVEDPKDAKESKDAPSGGLPPVLFLIPIALYFYFLMIRPMKKQRQQQELLLSSLKKNDEVETAWSLMTNFLKGWQQQGAAKLPQYVAGTWGPGEADKWIERDGRRWRRL